MAKPYFTCETNFTNPARIYFVEKCTLTGAFFMLYLPQKVRGIFGLKAQKPAPVWL